MASPLPRECSTPELRGLKTKKAPVANSQQRQIKFVGPLSQPHTSYTIKQTAPFGMHAQTNKA